MYAYDIDGDGKNDVITSGNAHGYGLLWFKNIDNKTFEKKYIMGTEIDHSRFKLRFSQLHAVELMDMDGDGVKDIITGKRFWAHGPRGDVEAKMPAVLYVFKLVREKGDVYFKPIKIDDNSGVGTQLNTGDINRDGLNDILISNKKGTFVFLQKKK